MGLDRRLTSGFSGRGVGEVVVDVKSVVTVDMAGGDAVEDSGGAAMVMRVGFENIVL